MHRRTVLARLAAALGAAALPLSGRANDLALSTARLALGWVAVIDRSGRSVISISPRFLLNHPLEAAHLMLHGRLP